MWQVEHVCKGKVGWKALEAHFCCIAWITLLPISLLFRKCYTSVILLMFSAHTFGYGLLVVVVSAERGALVLHLFDFKPHKDLLQVSDDVWEGWTEFRVHLTENKMERWRRMTVRLLTHNCIPFKRRHILRFNTNIPCYLWDIMIKNKQRKRTKKRFLFFLHLLHCKILQLLERKEGKLKNYF